MKRTYMFCVILALHIMLASAVPGYAAGADPAPVQSPSPSVVETEQPVQLPNPVETSLPVEAPAPEAILPAADDSELIKVNVPAAGQIVINPYGLPVKIGDETSMEQIASETLTMINEGETPVVVSASAVGSVSERSSLTYAAQPPQESGAKEIFLYAEFQKEDDSWLGSYTGADNQVLISEQISAPKEVLTLGAGTSQGVFRLFGAATVSPADPWCSDDVISVTLTFTFTTLDDPSVPEAAAVEELLEKPPVEELAGELADEPAEGPTEQPADEPAEGPTEQPTDEPAEGPTEQPTDEPAEQSSDEATEEPGKEPAGVPDASQEPDDAGETLEDGLPEATESDGGPSQNPVGELSQMVLEEFT